MSVYAFDGSSYDEFALSSLSYDPLSTIADASVDTAMSTWTQPEPSAGLPQAPLANDSSLPLSFDSTLATSHSHSHSDEDVTLTASLPSSSQTTPEMFANPSPIQLMKAATTVSMSPAFPNQESAVASIGDVGKLPPVSAGVAGDRDIIPVGTAASSPHSTSAHGIAFAFSFDQPFSPLETQAPFSPLNEHPPFSPLYSPDHMFFPRHTISDDMFSPTSPQVSSPSTAVQITRRAPIKIISERFRSPVPLQNSPEAHTADLQYTQPYQSLSQPSAYARRNYSNTILLEVPKPKHKKKRPVELAAISTLPMGLGSADPTLSPSESVGSMQSPKDSIAEWEAAEGVGEAIEAAEITEVKKRFVCTWAGCGKSFSTSGHLSRHTRIHLNIKPFCCPFPDCSSRFSRQDNMRQHYKIHFRNSRSRFSLSMQSNMDLSGGIDDMDTSGQIGDDGAASADFGSYRNSGHDDCSISPVSPSFPSSFDDQELFEAMGGHVVNPGTIKLQASPTQSSSDEDSGTIEHFMPYPSEDLLTNATPSLSGLTLGDSGYYDKSKEPLFAHKPRHEYALVHNRDPYGQLKSASVSPSLSASSASTARMLRTHGDAYHSLEQHPSAAAHSGRAGYGCHHCHHPSNSQHVYADYHSVGHACQVHHTPAHTCSHPGFQRMYSPQHGSSVLHVPAMRNGDAYPFGGDMLMDDAAYSPEGGLSALAGQKTPTILARARRSQMPQLSQMQQMQQMQQTPHISQISQMPPMGAAGRPTTMHHASQFVPSASALQTPPSDSPEMVAVAFPPYRHGVAIENHHHHA